MFIGALEFRVNRLGPPAMAGVVDQDLVTGCGQRGEAVKTGNDIIIGGPLCRRFIRVSGPTVGRGQSEDMVSRNSQPCC